MDTIKEPKQLALEEGIVRQPIMKMKIGHDGANLLFDERPTEPEAVRRLAQMLSIPTNFLGQCSPRLAREVVAEFAGRQHRGLNYIIGPDGGILSFSWDNHIHLPTKRILSALNDTLDENLAIVKERSGTNFSLFISSPKAFDAPDRKTLHFGVNYSSSLDGSSPTKLALSLYRPVCTNGAFITEGQFSLPRRSLSSIEDGILMLVDAAKTLYGMRENWMKNIEELSSHPVDNPQQELAHTIANLRLPPRLADLAYQAYEQEPNATRWGIFNAITRTANDDAAIDLANAEHLWGAAGRMIEQPAMACRLCGHDL